TAPACRPLFLAAVKRERGNLGLIRRFHIRKKMRFHASGGAKMRGGLKILGWLCAGALARCLTVASAAEPATTWKAGVARADTTPTAPVRMAGYASRTSPSQGVAHQLFAKALAISDDRGTKAVVVTCDIIAFRRTFTNRVIERVKTKHGLP